MRRSPETEFCLKKALECKNAAAAAADAKSRRTYLHLAELWREMAETAEIAEAAAPSGVIIDFPSRFAN
jgi:hypothetical protein